MAPEIKPHEQRVVEERTQLRERLQKLGAFIDSGPTFHLLRQIDAALLVRQRTAMTDYLNVLDQRVARFMED
jgi:hypothetical protein